MKGLYEKWENMTEDSFLAAEEEDTTIVYEMLNSLVRFRLDVKRKRKIEEIFKQLNCKKVPVSYGYLTFRYDSHPFKKNALEFSICNLNEIICHQECSGDEWYETLLNCIEYLGISHLYVQGREQRKILIERFKKSAVKILAVPRKINQRCEKCELFSCANGKMNVFLKEFHGLEVDLECNYKKNNNN